MKLRYVLLFVVLLCLLAACGESTQKAEVAPPTSPETPTVEPLDAINPDADIVGTGNQTTFNLGNVLPGQVLQPKVSFTLSCTGKQHVDNGQTVNVSFSLGQSTVPAGGVLAATNTTIGAIPLSWPDDTSTSGQTNCTPLPTPRDDNGDSTVTITAPSTAGAKTFVVAYTFSLSPAGANDNQAIGGSNVTVSYTMTVVPPTPTDTTPPTVNLSFNSPEGQNGWYRHNPVVGNLLATDTSGIASIQCVNATVENVNLTAGTATVTVTSEGSNAVSCTATDGASPANTGAAAGSSNTATIKIDTGAPVIAPLDITNTIWRNTPLSGAFAASDASSGLAVPADASFTLEVSAESANATTPTSVSKTIADNAGNSTTRSLSALIDLTAPNIVATATVGSNPYNGSFVNQDVTVSFSCSDALSGIAGTCPAPVVVSIDTAGQGVSASVSDAAGNTATSNVVTVKVDKTAPLLGTLPSNIVAEATSTAGASISFTAPTATDALDPAPTVSCAPASGAVFPLGTTAVTCTASDVSGNSSSGSFNVTVQDTTAPVVSVPGDISVEATGSTTTVTFSATASDLGETVAATCTPASGSAFSVGTTAVACSATDGSGNVGTASFNVTVQDTTAPVLDLPANISAEATSAAGAVVGYSASANDAVDGPVRTSCSPESEIPFGLGTTTVTCSATDSAGNSSTLSFTVTVVDSIAPTLSNMPANLSAEAASADGAIVSYIMPTASDAVDANPSVSCTPASGSVFALGDTTVSCTASDASGNTSAAQTFVVSVVDTTAPGISIPDGTLFAEATSSAGAVVTFEASASDLVDSNVEVNCTPASGSTFALGTTAVTCTATDASGNSSSDSFDVVVQDTTGPVLSVPENISAEATSSAGAVVSFSASATDAVDESVSVSCSATSGDIFPLGTTAVSCTATDDSENSSNASFTISVVDTTAPTLANMPENLSVEADALGGATVSYASPTASDLVDTNPAVSCAPASGSFFALGNTAVSCSATDAAGNTSAAQSFVVSVVDTTAPTVSVPENITEEATSSEGAVVSFSATASDVADADVTVNCVPASGSIFAVGTTSVTCSATDDSGNTGTASFSVTVQDNNAPVLNLPANITAEATSSAGATVNFIASATDSVDGDVAVTCTPASGSTFALGETRVSCSATDSSGNSSTASFTISVVDTSAPTLAEATNLSVEADAVGGATVSYSNPVASDVVDSNPAVTCSPASGGFFSLGDTTVSCSATDAAGNTSAERTFVVSVVDTTAPGLSVPDDIFEEATSAAGAVVSYSATATDIADADVTVSCTPVSGSTFVVGTTPVTCTATDDSSNTTEDSFSVTVQDNNAPVLNLPASITAEATSAAGAIVTFSATATDSVDGDVAVMCAPASGSTFALGETTVNCTATDSSGNSASGSFTVTVTDTTDPTITFVSRTTPSGEWTKENVTLEWSCSDHVGVVNESVSVTLSSEGAAQSATGTCVDTSGRTASDTQNGINIDKTAPTITVSRDLAPNANGWNNADVTANYEASDNLSGLNSPATGSHVFSTGAGQAHTFSVTDNAGNTATASISDINIDKTAPSITAVRDMAANANGWNNTDVGSSYSASDDLSGLSGPASGGFTFTDEGANQSHTFTVTDLAGNSASAEVTGVNIDKTLPSITATRAPAANGAGWNNSNVSASYTASDTLSGLTGDASGSYDFSAESAGQNHTFTVSDKAGNSASATVDNVNIDKTAPTTSASASPAPNTNGWNNSNVTVSFSGSDGSGSGIDSCTPSATLGEGANQAASGTCTDKAGNVSDPATASGINVDKTAPTLSPSVTPNSMAIGGTATVSSGATDALSGVASESCGTVDSSSAGTKTVSCTATDNAGNTSASASASYTVVAAGDTTPPVITRTITGTLGTNGWYRSTVSIVWTISDPDSAITTTAGCGTLLSSSGGVTSWRARVTADTAGVTFNCSATSSGGTTINSITIKRDATKPTITFASASPLANASGWNNTSVIVKFAGTDAMSGLASCPDKTVSTQATKNADGTFTGKTATGTCTDNAGNSATLVSPAFLIDKTKPVVGVTMNGVVTTGTPSYSLATGIPTASCSTSDALSGVASPAATSVVKITTTGEIPASNPPTATGSYRAKCLNASDVASNLNSGQLTFKVTR